MCFRNHSCCGKEVQLRSAEPAGRGVAMGPKWVNSAWGSEAGVDMESRLQGFRGMDII